MPNVDRTFDYNHPRLDNGQYNKASIIHYMNFDRFESLEHLDEGTFTLMFHRIYTDVYLDTPEILNNKKDRLNLFQLLFDWEEFYDIAYKQAIENSNIFDNFDHVDKDIKLLYTISDNHVGKILEQTMNVLQEDVKKEIRRLKMQKITDQK